MERPDDINANADVRQLKAEISDTQAELQQTVAEIQSRLSPATLKNQAVDTVRDAASNVRENVREATIGRMQHMVRGQNPVPFALIGIGAAWLLMNNRSSRQWSGSSDYEEYDASWDRSPSYRSSDDYGPPYESDVHTESSVRSRFVNAREEARHRANEVGRQARERVRRVKNQARSRWDMMLHDNPMALGIAALAAGALVGASLPRTEVENEYLGEARDNLVESARTMAQDSVDTAKTVAKETIEKVTGTEGQRT